MADSWHDSTQPTSSDVVETTSLGILMRSEKGKFTELAAFWAPFLLLHLRGPDTITAYSLEDNQLWGKHLLGLCCQVIVAAYLTETLYESDTVCRFNFLTFDDTASNFKDEITDICDKLEARYLHSGYTLIQFFKPLFLDLNIRLPYDFVLKGGFSISLKSCSSSLKLVDTEFDEIYTKRPLLNTFAGVILRCISFCCSFSALIVFSVFAAAYATRNQHSHLDIGISFVLLVGAVALEIYSIFAHCVSDWALLWATKTDNILSALICKANAKKLTSNRGNVQATTMLNIPQYNFINSWLTFRHIPSTEPGPEVPYGICKVWAVVAFFKDNFFMKWWCTTWEKIEWEKSIQTHLDKHFVYIQSVDVCQHKQIQDMEEFNLWKLFEKRLQEESDEGIKEETLKYVGIGDCIFILHLATDICYHVDAELCNFNNRDDYTTSKLLSDYMFYILMSHSSMLGEKGNHEFLFSEIQFNISAIFRHSDSSDYSHIDIDSARTFSSKLLESSCLDQYKGLRLPDIVKLARWLQEMGIEEKRGFLSEVWVETLAHVAMHCSGKEHLKCLARGGDLVSKVSLLMMLYGLGSRIYLLPNVQMEHTYVEYYGWMETELLADVSFRMAESKYSVEQVDVTVEFFTPGCPAITSLVNIFISRLSCNHSLGFLMRSEKGKFTEHAAFWAPFLLLHLGGPDTITA
ncbi:uncharacterized protein [Rutidosis leptorrhynchoides]|uniref:uncharacterized protein n=1 Tax=Rutidosis leptorrhynchoides TaxID=125765 RepID=UPI003A9A1ECA